MILTNVYKVIEKFSKVIKLVAFSGLNKFQNFWIRQNSKFNKIDKIFDYKKTDWILKFGKIWKIVKCDQISENDKMDELSNKSDITKFEKIVQNFDVLHFWRKQVFLQFFVSSSKIHFPEHIWRNEIDKK